LSVISRKLFPAVALVVSGGHTILLLMQSLTKWKKLGETRDDAAGEAFDKVAKILKLPYPGGPEIEKLAKKGNPQAIEFPRPMLNQKNYEFSFSGLKTAVLYYSRDKGFSHWPLATKRKEKVATLNPNRYTLVTNVAASFQQAVIDVLVGKTMRAVREFGAKSVMLSGGVAANKALRTVLNAECKKWGVKFFVPPMSLNTDNAAMIGMAGYMRFLQKKKLRLIAQPNLNL
jgi:N6-L-threonylcarbamoyladenine synthase